MIKQIILYVKKFLLEFLHINSIILEINTIHNKLLELDSYYYDRKNVQNVNSEKCINFMYPDVDDYLNYKWETYKFINVIPNGEKTNQIQIYLKHIGFKTNFSQINGANHKMLIKVIDPLNKASWQTPWMDACNATSPDAMFPVDGTRCIYGIYSNTEKRTCYIGVGTESRAIFFVRVGLPRELNLELKEINLKPCNITKKILN